MVHFGPFALLLNSFNSVPNFCYLTPVAGSMPDTFRHHRKHSSFTSHIVIIRAMLFGKAWLGSVSRAFALICQYLSSTRTGLGIFHDFLTICRSQDSLSCEMEQG